MKNVVSILVFLLLGAGFFARDINAQSDSKKIGHSLGFSILPNRFESGYYMYPFLDCLWYPYPSMQKRALPGFMYTIDYDMVYARIGLHGLMLNQNMSDGYYQNHQTETYLRPSLGFGGKSKKKYFDVLFGIDAYVLMSTLSYKYTYQTPEYNSKETQRETASGISPYIGLDIPLTKKLSLSYESALRVESYTKTTSYTYDINPPSNTNSNGIRSKGYLMNQLRFNFHF